MRESKHFVFVFMEYLPGGTLAEWVKYRKHGTISPVEREDEAREIMRSILSGVACIHELDYLHRDLKPENILFGVLGDAATLKIADFGLCAKYDSYSLAHSGTCGTRIYMAPEQLQHQRYGKVRYLSLTHGRV